MLPGTVSRLSLATAVLSAQPHAEGLEQPGAIQQQPDGESAGLLPEDLDIPTQPEYPIHLPRAVPLK